MLHIDVNAYRRITLRQQTFDSVDGGILHQGDHRRGSEDGNTTAAKSEGSQVIGHIGCGFGGEAGGDRLVQLVRPAVVVGKHPVGFQHLAVLAGEIWVPAEIAADAHEEADTAGLIERLATLTPQQVRVLMMLGEGLLNKQIAYQLGVSEATVKAHVSAILQKLEVSSRTQAVILANRLAIDDPTRDLPDA